MVYLAYKRKTSTPKVVHAEPVSTPVVKSPVATKPGKRWLLMVGVLGLVALLAYAVKNVFVVALVNGQPIYRHSIVGELEKQGGKQVADQKIMETLILQEAAKQNVTVPEADIDQEIVKLEEQMTAQQQNLDLLLEQEGMDRYTLRHQIRMQQLVQRLRPEPSQPSEEEITAALAEQAEFLPKEMSEAERRTTVSDQLRQDKSASAVNDWLESLRGSASIQYWKTY